MLDMGFIHDIKKIVAMLPKARQTLFFSATMPQQIVQLAAFMLRDPARVAVTPQATTAERVLAAFRDGKLRTLIATDIAARGIDVDGVSHVVNYDLPNIPESYVHRI